MVELQPLEGGYYIWKYVPSRVASIIFIVLFLLLTLVHLWKMIRTRAWFCIPFVLGGLFETVGYIGRAISYDKTNQLGPYIMQSVTILIAPALFAASIYMCLGLTIRAVRAESLSLIRVKRLTTLFVVGDVLSFFIQSGGAGLLASADKASAGEKIVIGGLIVQVLFFGLFIITAILFHKRLHNAPTAESRAPEIHWRAALYTLYAMSVLILVRSVFRVIEFADGNDGYLLSHEWTLYIFDALLMFVTMVVFAVWHPADIRNFALGNKQALSNIEMGIHDSAAPAAYDGQGRYKRNEHR